MPALESVDLNLLLSLKALLAHQHVSRAADAAGITQSGMSRNLARLRALFADELMVRVGHQMLLTPRAEQLQNELESVLASIDKLIRGEHFSAATTTMHFRVAAADFVGQLLFPLMCEALLKQAPGLTLDWHAWNASTLTDLEKGKLDFALGGVDEAPAGIYRRVLERGEPPVCVSRRQHNAITEPLTLQTYCALQHVMPTLEGYGPSPVDEELAAQGYKRNVVIRTPHFMSAFALVAHTDMLLTVNPQMALIAGLQYPVDRHVLPFQVSLPPFCLLWHQRNHQNPAHLWFRERVGERVGTY